MVTAVTSSLLYCFVFLLCSELAVRSNRKGNLTPPPRNMQHVYNEERKLRKRTKIHHDDVYDVARLMEFTDEKVITDMKLGKKFRVIQKHDELMNHFEDVRKKSEYLVLGYDTTFSMGKPTKVNLIPCKSLFE